MIIIIMIILLVILIVAITLGLVFGLKKSRTINPPIISKELQEQFGKGMIASTINLQINPSGKKSNFFNILDKINKTYNTPVVETFNPLFFSKSYLILDLNFAKKVFNKIETIWKNNKGPMSSPEGFLPFTVPRKLIKPPPPLFLANCPSIKGSCPFKSIRKVTEKAFGFENLDSKLFRNIINNLNNIVDKPPRNKDDFLDLASRMVSFYSFEDLVESPKHILDMISINSTIPEPVISPDLFKKFQEATKDEFPLLQRKVEVSILKKRFNKLLAFEEKFKPIIKSQLNKIKDGRGEGDTISKIFGQLLQDFDEETQILTIFTGIFIPALAPQMLILRRAIPFLLYFLAKNREYIKKIREEINTNPTTFYKKENTILHYSTLEILRLSLLLGKGALATNAMRSLNQDIIIDKYLLKKGYAILNLTTFSISNQIKNPLRFIPERWKNLPKNDKTLMGFGFSPRKCAGATLAIVLIKGVVGYLIKNYSYEIDKKIDIENNNFLVTDISFKVKNIN